MNRAPTPFPELNAVLAGLVGAAQSILGNNFYGAYLTGSFAVGDADMQSDCDFLVVTSGPLTGEHESALRVLHDDIPTRPGHWTKHLEGSYPPKQDLQTLEALEREWLYIDHGWREMQWSTHCNREVTRWSLRERGVTLAGPEPRTFVGEVPPEVLRSRMRRDIQTLLPDLLSWTTLSLAWSQRYAVATVCRILYTVHFGEVGSKREAMTWAGDELGPPWQPLIQSSLDERERGYDEADRAAPERIDATLRLIEHARHLIGAR
ncbi:MAG TPA: aminoglycoside adenylyltransferase domain-containing protein [Actinomycetota bacterium]|nr:aminoglycoside adenylyltransferase domain-containing protein [Actinomycetota bacterium]